MQERSTVPTASIESAALFGTGKAEVLEKGAHLGKVRRGKADMGNILDLDDRHRFGLPLSLLVIAL
jgi:hypothetical protein